TFHRSSFLLIRFVVLCCCLFVLSCAPGSAGVSAWDIDQYKNMLIPAVPAVRFVPRHTLCIFIWCADTGRRLRGLARCASLLSAPHGSSGGVPRWRVLACAHRVCRRRRRTGFVLRTRYTRLCVTGETSAGARV